MIDFLFRDSWSQMRLSPVSLALAVPKRRSGSPTPGCSILMTSAPNSASRVPQNGAARERRDVEHPHPVHRARRPAAALVSPWPGLHVSSASCAASAQASAATGLLSTPIPVISTSTRSPGPRAGDFPSVPIHTTSPGYRVR